jgi:hypothetical protein
MPAMIAIAYFCPIPTHAFETPRLIPQPLEPIDAEQTIRIY